MVSGDSNRVIKTFPFDLLDIYWFCDPRLFFQIQPILVK